MAQFRPKSLQLQITGHLRFTYFFVLCISFFFCPLIPQYMLNYTKSLHVCDWSFCLAIANYMQIEHLNSSKPKGNCSWHFSLLIVMAVNVFLINYLSVKSYLLIFSPGICDFIARWPTIGSLKIWWSLL